MSGERKPPEATSAAPGSPGSVWLPMREAAEVLGLSERAARDWVKRHAIPQRGERPVLVSEAALLGKLAEVGRLPRQSPEAPAAANGSPRQSPEGTRGSPEPIEAAFHSHDEPPLALVPLAPMLEQLRGLGDQLAALAERNEALALEVGTLRERTEHQAATLVEERRRVEVAERERDAAHQSREAIEHERETLKAQLAAQAQPPPQARSAGPRAAETAPQTSDGSLPTPTLWQRLKRALAG